MDSNNLYQSQQTGTEPDNNQPEVYQNNDAYQTDNLGQNGDTYQTGGAYQGNDAYQNDGAYQQSGYNQYDQNNGYNNNGNYNNGSYGNYNAGNYSNGNYSNGNYGNSNYGNNGNYNNGSYGGNYNGNYGNGSYQMPYQPSQLDLEEPVKMSEWLVSLLLMMVPCLNIVMMFVWAFSKTEKKSKSNYFKAQLIMAGVVFALYFVIVIMMVAAGLFY